MADEKKAEDVKPRPTKDERTIRAITSQAWLDPFSERWISADLKVSPHSGAKRTGERKAVKGA